MNFKKIWACDHLKTSKLSADNFKKYSTLMGRHLSPRYGQVILVSGYPVLTAVNWPQHWCAISFLLGSQSACGADGRSVGHVINKFSGMGRFMYLSCSSCLVLFLLQLLLLVKFSLFCVLVFFLAEWWGVENRWPISITLLSLHLLFIHFLFSYPV